MSKATEKYEKNLEILSKLSNGDMLAAADKDGLFKRKTNLLTQSFRHANTHDKELMKEIQEVLSRAAPPEHDPPHHMLNSALKGLATLASTYQSKGAKEWENFSHLSEIIVMFNQFLDIPQSTELKNLAKNALRFLNNCRIRSVNNNRKLGWGNSYFSKDLDWLIFYAFVRAETKGQGEFLRQEVLKIMRSDVSRSTKKEKLVAVFSSFGLRDNKKSPNKGLGRYNLNEFANVNWKIEGKKSLWKSLWKGNKSFWDPGLRIEPDKERILLARRAIMMRFGNCLDKSCIIATHIAEATAGNSKKPGIALVEGDPYNHAWVFISNDRNKLENALGGYPKARAKPQPKQGFKGKLLRINQFTDYPKDTIVVDGRTRDTWTLRDYFNKPANLRQVGVRSKIRDAVTEGGLTLTEMVRWPPPPVFEGEPQFRLAFAHIASERIKSIHQITNQLQPKDSTESADFHAFFD